MIADTSALERQMNKMVYEVYDLMPQFLMTHKQSFHFLFNRYLKNTYCSDLIN